MIQKNINKRKAPIGSIVTIRAPHPWKGYSGKIISHDQTMMGLAAKIDLLDGVSCYVYDHTQLEIKK